MSGPMNVRVTHENGTSEGVVLSTIHVSDPDPKARVLTVIVDSKSVHIPWTRVLKVEEISRV